MGSLGSNPYSAPCIKPRANTSPYNALEGPDLTPLPPLASFILPTLTSTVFLQLSRYIPTSTPSHFLFHLPGPFFTRCSYVLSLHLLHISVSMSSSSQRTPVVCNSHPNPGIPSPALFFSEHLSNYSFVYYFSLSTRI